MEEFSFDDSFTYRLIYIVRINDMTHYGMLKIGQAEIPPKDVRLGLEDNSEILNKYATRRINEWTVTAGLDYTLLYTSLAVANDGECFQDTEVHDVLERSGYEKVKIGKAREWFRCDLETAKSAVKARKEGRPSLYPDEKHKYESYITLRPEQQDAVDKTIKHFKKNKNVRAHYLWNAKMRFGKTISALTMVKELGYQKTIIVTHRPVVNQGWLDDFDKVFYDRNDYQFGYRDGDNTIKYLQTGLEKYGKNFVYFASLQDLRGSATVGGNFNKNEDVFNIEWDLVIIDEAHEGTQTALGDDVLKLLIKSGPNTKTLYLSGTPFNLLSDQSTAHIHEDEIYTWDYISEQEAKIKWVEEHLGDSNPYESLPKMNIYTYDLKEILKSKDQYVDLVDAAFSFKEFFRVCTSDDLRNPKFLGKYPDAKLDEFVHERDVNRFLDLLVENGDHNYPFSTEEYRNNFRHTLWMVPGVKEARALSKLLKSHRVFQSFEIVNVAGSGDEEEPSGNALRKVEDAIRRNRTDGYTITLSCGRLTTGVTVPEWTACLMLSGSNSTSASSYLQTIFRVQSPATIGGKMKTNCFVFDFAPDRTLKIIAEASNISTRPGDTKSNKSLLKEFLNYCPVIGFDGSSMKAYSTDNLVSQLNRVYIDRVVRSGFDDDKLYNDNLKELTDDEIEKFRHLQNIVKASKSEKIPNDIEMNKQGMNNEVYEADEKKPKKEMTAQEIEDRKEKERLNGERQKAIMTLRAISRRIPLMIYGVDVEDFNEEISVEDFIELVDDKSWEEFMPIGVTKDLFREFIKYYDENIFKSAGSIIRKKVKAADELPPLERVQAITDIFKIFKNPDRETVLTPWNVVNLHLGECLGGANFLDEDGKEIIIDDNTSPRWIESKLPGLTNEVFNTDAKILEINSKTGLYPLYAAISIYQNILNKGYRRDTANLWKEILENNIYVVCRTNMAERITTRTLKGFDSQMKINVIVVDNMAKQMSEEYKNGYDKLVEYIENGKTWNKGEKNMKFKAVIGNPPYQSSAKQQIYTDFYLLSRQLGEVVSLIFPVGWQEPKSANNLFKMNTTEIKADEQIVFIDNRQNIFPGIAGAEWTNFILWKKDYNNGLNGEQRICTNGSAPINVLLKTIKGPDSKPSEIIDLVNSVMSFSSFSPVQDEISPRMPYGIPTDAPKYNEKYGIPPFQKSKIKENDKKIYCMYEHSRAIMWLPASYKTPRESAGYKKYKVFVPYAWGNMSEKAGLGGAYSDIIVANPYEICSETYQELGAYDSKELAIKAAKYISTKFARACLYYNKHSQHSTQSWGAVPSQDFSEPWWNESIDKIDDYLFDKYNVPQNIREYVKRHIQKRSEDNIFGINDEI